MLEFTELAELTFICNIEERHVSLLPPHSEATSIYVSTPVMPDGSSLSVQDLVKAGLVGVYYMGLKPDLTEFHARILSAAFRCDGAGCPLIKESYYERERRIRYLSSLSVW